MRKKPKGQVEVTMINEKDGYAVCDADDVPAVLEELTGKKLEREPQQFQPKKGRRSE
jgi:hypothetical protein